MTIRSRLLHALSGSVMTFGMVYVNIRVLCDLTGISSDRETALLLAAVFGLIAAAVLLTPHPLLALTVPVLVTGGAFAVCREEVLAEVYRLFVCLTDSPVAGYLFRALLKSPPSPGEINDTFNGPVFFWIPLFAAWLCASFLILYLSRVRGMLWYTVFNTLLFAALAVFMNAMPSGWLTALFAALHMALVLSSLLVERGGRRAGAVTLGLLLPCFIVSAGLWGALRYYERPAFTDRIVERSVELYKDLSARRKSRTGSGGSGTAGGGGSTKLGEDTLENTRAVPIGAFPWNRYADRVELDETGPRRPLDTPVMEVYSDRERTLYLRGVSYDQYEPDGWSNRTVRTEGVEFTPFLFVTDAAPTEQLRVRLAVASNLLWLPYTPTELPKDTSVFQDAYVFSEPLTDYSVLYKPNAAFAPVSWEYRNYVYLLYGGGMLPDETREALSEVTALFDPEDPNLVFRIADYVRNCAVYDTDTPAMPAGEDFVPWFLTESDRGYCVHFASAAAVLLRCFNIPARYVTGYMVKAQGSGWTEVTEDDAHAWVEYFDDSLVSWRVLEPTPSLSNPAEEEAETESPAPTAPLPNLRNEPAETEPREQSVPRADPVRPARGRTVSALWLIPAALLAAAVLWPVTRAVRRKLALRKADPNGRVLLLWRLSVRLLSASKAEEPDSLADSLAECLAIAEKARFSPHTVTPEEIARVEALSNAARASVRCDKNLPRRLAVRWFMGV